MAPSRAPALEPAAGFSLDSRPERPDQVPLAKGEFSVASRALALSTYFLSGALAINISQFLGAPLRAINEDWYNAWIAFTKQSFGLLTMTLTQTFAPTKVIISGDKSVRGQLLKSTEGDLILDFPERLVLIANHQIYTDWLYLWWIAYCNGMHGRLYIILKESLRKIPVIGWGMQLYQFIFLKRNWEQDKPHMASALQRLNKPTDPMWLLLFPEGTNLAPSTRKRSAEWAKKNNIPDTRHVLLPRSTGLQFCLEELKDTVDYLYDCTIVYEGVPRGQYAQDIFTLKAGYLEGRPPKSVSMHWRRFAVKEIPLHNDRAFELWLRARWREKDVMIEEYYQTGKLPADYGATKYKSGKVLRGCGHMEVPIRASHWYEFLQIFAPMGILAMILYIFYGDLPKRFWKSINKQALQAGTEDIKKAGIEAGKGVQSASSALSGLTLDSFFEPGKQEETFAAGAMAVQKLLTSPQAQTVLNRADFIQAFLSDPQKMVQDSIADRQQNFLQQLAQEEAKRQQGRIAPTGGAAQLRPAANATAKGDFWNQVQAEEKSRRGSVISKTAKNGTFWDAVKAEEQSRRGSVTSVPTSTSSKQSKGTFWQDLKAAEEKKAKNATTTKPPLTTSGGRNLAALPKGNFWDAVKAEENSRYGTVMTLSSNATTAVASTNSAPGKKAPAKLEPSVAKKPSPATQKASKPTTNGQKTTATTRPAKVASTGGAATPAVAKKPGSTTTTKNANKKIAPSAPSKPPASLGVASTNKTNTPNNLSKPTPLKPPPSKTPKQTAAPAQKPKTANTKATATPAPLKNKPTNASVAGGPKKPAVVVAQNKAGPNNVTKPSPVVKKTAGATTSSVSSPGLGAKNNRTGPPKLKS
ncbi:uncharacterized protein Z520_06945 [Fonsecaea multimorphosa CBS 102226]|uniref:Phospholipid/glycerol acyltransferase domain-containing protein n=1 Tax=Fonsecaea multimorphosa CBS 102226 TaxID=1442371 RepID=A0A0D2KLH2_9EURO|nr:uncharacterized protein Z520_06945 [Fonsecaea multimorphosa CBS 102226]KIX97493.1 hypothetical protein Z520_06945 [Fonsecaea multimorphosa CBS 102226]OAL23455.1 hypothetical protein AYO22_06505 [Fonsecaea multimorphosa]